MKTQHVFKVNEPNSPNPFKGIMYSFSLICCIYFSFLIGTQYVAFKFGLHGFYQPYMGFVWAFLAQMHGDKEDVFITGLRISGISMIVSFLSVHIISKMLKGKPKVTDTHGSAKWAIEEDLGKAKLLDQDEGLYIGGWQNEKKGRVDYLRDNTQSHILAVAPTGAGKGVGLVTPNLLSWPGSVIVFDLKGENFLLTSGYRKNELNQNVVAFNPTSVDKVIVKQELDEIGIDWATFVEKLTQAGFAEQIDPQRIILKEDFSVIKDKLEELFPGDIDNNDFLSVMQRPQFGSCACFNPLNEIRKGAHEVKDTQNLVETICDPDGKAGNNHWVLSSKSLLTAAILHTLYARKDKSLAGVVELISDPKRPIYAFLDSMLKTQHDPLGLYGWKDSSGFPTRIHPTIASLAREMKNKGFEEFSGIVSTTMSFLSPFRDPILAQNTSRSDFTITDIIRGDKPLSLYIIVPPSDLQRIVPLLRILINQICGRLMENSSLVMSYNMIENITLPIWQKITQYSTQWIHQISLRTMKRTGAGEGGIKLEANAVHVLEKISNFSNRQANEISDRSLENRNQQIKNIPMMNHKVLLMLDEFPALGKMENLKTAISYMRGYGLRAFLICQDLEQLNEKYGNNNSIIGHCDIRISYAANSEFTAQKISGLAGVTTIPNYTKNYSGSNTSIGESEIKRALILPDEILHLPDTDMLIFAHKMNIYGAKIIYYKDPWFLKMSQIKPVLMSDRLSTKNDFSSITNVVEYEEPRIDAQKTGKTFVGKLIKEMMQPPEMQKDINKNKNETFGSNKPADFEVRKLC